MFIYVLLFIVEVIKIMITINLIDIFKNESLHKKLNYGLLGNSCALTQTKQFEKTQERANKLFITKKYCCTFCKCLVIKLFVCNISGLL